MTRIMRGLGALSLLVLVLVGIPALLLAIGRLDVFGSITWQTGLTRPDDGRLLLGVLTVAGWAAWLVVTLTVVFEAVSVLTLGRWRPRLPGTAWLRPSAAVLVLAVVGLLAGQVATTAPVVASPSPTSEPIASSPATEPTATAPTASTPAPGPAHVVIQGDDLWSLAEHYLGTGAEWRAIAALNPSVDPAAPLVAGTRLALPVTAPAVPQPAQPAQPEPQAPVTASQTGPVASDSLSPVPEAQAVSRSVTVLRGDSLWAIAERELGEATRWPEIYRLNSDQIADPDEIDVGWVLRLPVCEASVSAAEESTPQAELPPADTPPRPAPQMEPPVGRPVSTSVPSPDASNRDHADESSPRADVDSTGDMAALVASIGGALALGLVTVLARHRLRQLWQRHLGRRVPTVDDGLRRFEHALALRTSRPDPPPVTTPTTIVLGWRADEAVTLDVEQHQLVLMAGDPEHTGGALAAISSSLACAEWSEGVEHALVGRVESWTDQVDDPAVTTLVTTEAGITRLAQLVAARRLALMSHSIEELRRDPDLAAVWQPVVFLFGSTLTADQLARVRALVSSSTGVSAVACCARAEDATVVYTDDGASFDGQRFDPQLLSAPARHALIELFRGAASDETTLAPWWSDDDLPPNVTPLRSTDSPREERTVDVFAPSDHIHPTLLLLGPVELHGTAGTPPNRAISACQEYCAWLLAHPGGTATQMAKGLMIAEPTRRSNMSRLRTWLGQAPDGGEYLPDAYSGRIALRSEVTSDWEQFNVFTMAGINRTSAAGLRRALELVRGTPLADRAPLQWQWAEDMRTDMVSAVRDAGVVLSGLALAAGDLELARWAIERASVAAPDDELLLANLARVENACGNGEEVKRIVMVLTRRARMTGVELQQDTVSALQEALEGRRRLREI